MFAPHRALITGGSGFIGCNLAARLLQDGCEVVIYDNFSRAGVRHNLDRLDGPLTVVAADVRDYATLRALVEQVDVVYHLAAQVAVTTSLDHPLADFEVNAMGTLHVLEAARLAPNPPIVLYASTNKVYGDLAWARIERKPTRYAFIDRDGVKEDDPLDLQTPYGCSKGAGDLYCQEYARSYGLRTVVFRQSCIYGPYQTGSEEQGWVAWFARQVAAQLPITIYGDGLQVRDLLHVEDLLAAYAAAIDRIDVAAGQVYNVGGGPEFALSIWQEFRYLLPGGRDAVVYYGDWRPHDQRVYISDLSKARAELDWTPRICPADGITELHSRGEYR